MPSPAPAKKKLVRIRPSVNREVHVLLGYHFRKADGWVEVPPHVAKACEAESTNDLNPEAGEAIFDVKDAEEAKRIAEAEKKRVEPAGSPEKPKTPTRTPDPPAKRGKPARGEE